jgi:hypothetical protein
MCGGRRLGNLISSIDLPRDVVTVGAAVVAGEHPCVPLIGSSHQRRLGLLLGVDAALHATPLARQVSDQVSLRSARCVRRAVRRLGDSTSSPPCSRIDQRTAASRRNSESMVPSSRIEGEVPARSVPCNSTRTAGKAVRPRHRGTTITNRCS